LLGEPQEPALAHGCLTLVHPIQVKFRAGVSCVGGELLERDRGSVAQEACGSREQVRDGHVVGGVAEACADHVGRLEGDFAGSDGGRDIHKPWC
jgi:hypothetical protein